MRAPAALPRIACLASLGLAPACLEVPDPDRPMCKTTADCDAGELCDEGVCWGNPPAGMFAAVVSPPSQRSADLVSREVLALPISGDGWIEAVHLEGAVSFKGRLQAQCDVMMPCEGRMLGATITVTRPSVFQGGPGFRKVVTVGADADTFEINVPATRPDDPMYTITVVPDGRDAPGPGGSLAQLVPPLQTRIAIPASASGNLLELGGPGLPRVTGSVTTAGGGPLAGYRVVALGRWEPEQAPTEVSTVDFTGADGAYAIALSRGLVGDVELVARPFNLPPRPELRLGGIPAPLGAINKVLAVPGSTTGAERLVEIIVDHKDTGGEIAPVSGARVRIAGSVATGANASVRFAAEGTTNDAGVVRLTLLDTEQLEESYRLSVIPPPSSKASALFAKPYAVQASTAQRLGTRIAITGAVHGADGHAMADVSVTARPSVRFLWNLEPGSQAFLGEIPTATVVTPDTGEFVLFVDHALTNGTGGQPSTVWGHYDLTFEPTKKARAPSWTRTGVELPRDAAQSTLALGPIGLPDAAYVRGHVFDNENAHVEGAEVKLYQVQIDGALCLETRFEPQSCPIPPLLLGRAASDPDGVARLTLPR